MNKTCLAMFLALSVAATGFAAGERQFTNREEDIYTPIDELNQAKEPIPEAKDIKDTRTKEEKKAQAPMPINMSADHAEYDSVSGDFHIKGNVVVTQGREKILTTEAFGNAHTGDIYLEKGGSVVEPDNISHGKWAHYNFNTKTGEIKEITGRSNSDIYSGPHATVYPDKIVLDEGAVMQRCPAKKRPCFSVTAKSFELYPKDKMVAKDVKVYMRGKHIYSRDLWVNRFGERKMQIRPRIGYSKKNGFLAKADITYNVTKDFDLSAEIPYYTKAGYKPNYQAGYYTKNFSLKYLNGWEYKDDYWYHKQNDFLFNYHPHHFIKGLPLSFSAYYEHGYWRSWNIESKQTSRSSWHTEYGVYLNHDPIRLFNSDKTTLNLTVGKRWTKESATEETQTTNLYYATLNQVISPKWKVWTGYYHENRTSALFDLHEADMDREWRMGVQFAPDKNNVLTVVNRYDTATRRNYETDIRWLHRFCCWSLEFVFENEVEKNDRNFYLNYYFDWM